METPVLFLVFNRPDVTRIVFERIREVRPKFLYVAADGAREGNAKDIENCSKVRAIFNEIDWSCELHTLYRDVNLGCGKAVSSSISWFFDNVEEGIIIEDDCLVSNDFFKYAEIMLDIYRDREDVYHISSHNVLFMQDKPDTLACLTGLPHIWGWATWRNIWRNYSYDLNMYEVNEVVNEKFKNKRLRQYWFNIFKKVASGEINTWDYQWAFTMMKNKAFAITPYYNMVKNIGHGEDATHITSDFVEIGEDAIPQSLFNGIYEFEHDVNAEKIAYSFMLPKRQSIASGLKIQIYENSPMFIKNIWKRCKKRN